MGGLIQRAVNRLFLRLRIRQRVDGAQHVEIGGGGVEDQLLRRGLEGHVGDTGGFFLQRQRAPFRHVENGLSQRQRAAGGIAVLVAIVTIAIATVITGAQTQLRQQRAARFVDFFECGVTVSGSLAQIRVTFPGLFVNLQQVLCLAHCTEAAQAQSDKKGEQFLHLHSLLCSNIAMLALTIDEIVADSSRVCCSHKVAECAISRIFCLSDCRVYFGSTGRARYT
ncbi:hypothetical protein D3C79_657110 [compost metagenome]